MKPNLKEFCQKFDINIEEIIKTRSDTLSESERLAQIDQDAENIQYIKNPSEAVQLAAVKNDGTSICYIDNPSEQVKLAAVTENGNALRYISNASYEVQIAAVSHIHPTTEVVGLLLAESNNGSCYKSR